MGTAQKGKKPSPETVWAILEEVSRNQKETDRQRKETEHLLKELAESRKEAERRLEENDRQLKESDRQRKESAADFNKRLGALTNLFGEVTEYMMAPKLREGFMELGLEFEKASRNIAIKSRANNISLEIDVMLENGDKVMLVEIKTRLTNERVDNHIKRLEKMRRYADLRGDTRAFLGAVAGVAAPDEAKEYARGQGLYVVEPEGEELILTPPIGQPREW